MRLYNDDETSINLVVRLVWGPQVKVGILHNLFRGLVLDAPDPAGTHSSLKVPVIETSIAPLTGRAF